MSLTVSGVWFNLRRSSKSFLISSWKRTVAVSKTTMGTFLRKWLKNSKMKNWKISTNFLSRRSRFLIIWKKEQSFTRKMMFFMEKWPNWTKGGFPKNKIWKKWLKMTGLYRHFSKISWKACLSSLFRPQKATLEPTASPKIRNRPWSCTNRRR